uniref:Ras-related protein Rab-32 n=1 Tax=Panagrellus redivivus TaxID=6233 RepID=A0A7E4V248_PANRE
MMSSPPSLRKPILKVIVLGDSGVGKTSLVEQFVNRRFKDRHVETIGMDILSKAVTVGGTDAKLEIWDTAGQERFRSIAHNYYRGADCCVLVLDLTRHKSLSNLENWQEEFLYRSDVNYDNDFPFVVLANKLDAENLRTVSDYEIKKVCKKLGNLPFFYVSSKDVESVDKAFAKISELSLAHSLKELRSLPDIASLTGKEVAVTGYNWFNWCPLL